MHLRVARDCEDRVRGLIVGRGDRGRDHGDFEPGAAHAFERPHQIDIGDVRIHVAAFHHGHDPRHRNRSAAQSCPVPGKVL